ncbi:Hypothetical protein R9X50_00045500 [Acrodontium crateriforme]|uniref:Uncharacterized protein n=1 Tax=Acrodontium crateriforme TaxID=150365 RepID=A0AAQ3R6X6_9PEZI|nr:Hypothetical protein R9X50_00045500 [Acrodontium crateriforme]
MPAVPGEHTLTTLFSDVHYYFTPPNQRPAHERFARGSYLYLYHNQQTRRARLEIANHAGTPNQDAFAGDLDSALARAVYSYKQPNLCTLTVEHASPQDQTQWHITSFDERNEQRRPCKIHTLDLYLFTEKDAAVLLQHLASLLPADRMDIRDAPTNKTSTLSEHHDSMSPVVQRLEQTAISTPRTGSVISAQSSLLGPPTPVSPPPASIAPTMGYNPAAPSAPEPIAHREKTPPPPDDGTGTGLKPHAPYNSGQSYPTQGFFPGPPQQNHGMSFAGPPSGAGIPPPPLGGPSAQIYTQGFPGPPTGHQMSPPVQQSVPSFGPNAPPTPGFMQGMPPAYGLHTPLQSPGIPPPPPTSQHQHQQQAPVVQGFSDYTYSSTSTGASSYATTGRTGAYNGDVHSQVYRPTAQEAAHGHGGHSYHGPAHGQQNLESGSGSAGRQRLEAKSREVEKKVGGVLKWLDKKL